MYLKEMIKYYHPWLIFFIIGIPVLLKKLKEEYYWFVFLAILIMFVPLQLSKGKASRYLIMVTPFLSVIVSIGILRFSKVKNFFKGFAVYTTLLEYRLAYNFYLSDSFEHWSNTRFSKWTEEGKTLILLLTHPAALKSLPNETVTWVEIDADRYHVLLTGVRK